MITIISPAKILNKNIEIGTKERLFDKETINLVNILKQMNFDDLKESLNLSQQLTTTVLNYYKNYDEKYPAVFLYGGIAFKALDASSVDKDSLSNLYILSPLYGLINALSSISYYRLDLHDKIAQGSLTNYWFNVINEYLKVNFNNTLIINLASNEFSKLLDLKNPNIVTIDFQSNRKLNSTKLKQLRGAFARYIIINNIDEISKLVKLELEGFKYDQSSSSINKFVFKD